MPCHHQRREVMPCGRACARFGFYVCFSRGTIPLKGVVHMIVIFSGLLGSFLAFLLTYYKDRKEQRNRLKVNCRILLHEANRHLFWLTKIPVADLSYWLRTQDDFKEWETLKYQLAAFTTDEFGIVFEHFTKMKAMKATFTECPEVIGYPEDSIEEAIRFASEAHKLLCWYAYRDDPEKLRKYYPDANPDKSPYARNENKFFPIQFPFHL